MWKKFTEEQPEIGRDIIFSNGYRPSVGVYEGTQEKTYSFTGYRVKTMLSVDILTDKYYWLYVPEVPERKE